MYIFLFYMFLYIFIYIYIFPPHTYSFVVVQFFPLDKESDTAWLKDVYSFEFSVH